MTKLLVAFDTEHVKHYIFGTDTLREIRGASSLLDYLNRIVMRQLAKSYQAEEVYAHGGSGLFLIDAEQADTFGKSVQRAYRDVTRGGASLTYIVSQALPEYIQTITDDDIAEVFELLQWRLMEEKLHPPEVVALATHPFLRLCDACGLEYADASSASERVPRNEDERDAQFCASCQQKRFRDQEVKTLVEQILAQRLVPEQESLWNRLIPRLKQMGYDLSQQPGRPADFNVFSELAGAKNYLGLIYADANNMGRAIAGTHSLLQRQQLARQVDSALDEAVCTAILQYLKVTERTGFRGQSNSDERFVFPFDILLLGGDDICMVVPAAVAMDVALTLAETFRAKMENRQTLSVSVVLAPVKYPFGLLQDMAETSLKFAKQQGSDARVASPAGTMIDDTRINFLVVTGGSSNDFKAVYENIYHADYQARYPLEGQDFYATLRPYTPANLRQLLSAIRSKDGANLGRTKLHQMREAILQMNITTSVGESLAILRNWRPVQRDHIVCSVYAFAREYGMQPSNLADPVAGFPRVIFPWFKDGQNNRNGNQIFRTPLLDLIELYDFLSREGGETGDED
jgi:hypothetical protein